MVLELPQGIFGQVGSGSLVMELKVDVRQTEEVITSKGGPIKYEFYNIPYDWAEAERHCQKQGGHLLASVHSKKDQEKLEALSGFQDVWLARKWLEVDGWVGVQLFKVEANSWEEQKRMPPKPDACLGCR